MKDRLTKATKGASMSIRPSTFISGRDWRQEGKLNIRTGTADAHKAADAFPAHQRRALKLYADWIGKDFGEAAAFVVSRGALIMLAKPDVDAVRDSVNPILQHGTPEEQDTLERFKYQVDAKDGVKRLDVHLTVDEVRPVSRLVEILGLPIQTVLSLSVSFVLSEVPSPGNRADWRARMKADCAAFSTRLAERATWARETAAKYTAGAQTRGSRVS